MAQTNGVVDNLGNIINHVEKYTKHDIMDFDEIIIYITSFLHTKNSTDIKYHLIKNSDNIFTDKIYNKIIKNKSQIFNRLQYIRQCGYNFNNFASTGSFEGMCHVSDGKSLEIEFV